MPGDFTATSSTTIDAPPDRVWNVITDPAAAREFMFGAKLETDWAEGSPITWSGEWDGKPYQDRGKVLEVDPGRRLVHTHFSALSGEDDVPENYHTLTWTLQDRDGGTHLTLAQDNNPSQEAANHSKGMWDKLVADVKAIAERP
ncbi:SRPBCC domain-containing protein [Pseudarthrobacter sp. SL88]|uniref:SRPBCC domain-containing protein n=1 Tax=Pseudarthrobacter sp. SL88 TaxID=2994666 RepID=UPI0022755254|nr:SRPBCC domain-containing protein [Pseudarthrobacter sp. SL88]MCY1676178.1 SRPBCC domain-containing protein [Pseudarthrobacter sp. SL88]